MSGSETGDVLEGEIWAVVPGSGGLMARVKMGPDLTDNPLITEIPYADIPYGFVEGDIPEWVYSHRVVVPVGRDGGFVRIQGI